MKVSRYTAGGSLLGIIIAALFAVEAGYVNDPNDPGGETNHGITIEVARKDGYTGSMKDLTQERAAEIYKKNYITKPGFEPFLELSPALAHKLIDIGVNTGPKKPSCWLQESLNSVSRNGQDFSRINVDCQIGPATVAAYQGLIKKRGRVQACSMMIKLLDAKQAAHYTSLGNLYMYTPGWVINRIGNIEVSKCAMTPETYK